MNKRINRFLVGVCLAVFGQICHAQESQQLEPNKPVEREIAGGQQHTYRISLAAKQFVRVIAGQKQANVLLELLDPQGRTIVEADLASSFQQESLSHEGAAAGEHLLRVRMINPAAPAGTYRLQLETRPTSAIADRVRISAERSLIEAKPLAAKGGPETQQAIEKYEKVLPQWRELGDRYWEAQTLNSLGRAFTRINDMDRAAKSYKEALQINRESNDRASEGYTLNNIGTVHYYLGRYQEAKDTFEQVLAIKRELKDRDGEGGTLYNIGAAYNTIGDQDKSAELYAQALPIIREVKNRRSEANILVGLGNVHSALDKYDKAIEFHQQSLLIYRELKDRETEALTLNNLGLVHNQIGRSDEAIKYFDQALEIARQVRSSRIEATALNGLGLANFNLSRYAAATEYTKQALQIYRDTKNKFGEKGQLGNLGMYASAQGQYDQAIVYLEESAAASREMKDRIGEKSSLNNLGIVYNYLGRQDKAIEFMERALALDRELKDKSGEAKALNNIGIIHFNLGDHRRAIEYYEQGLQIIREVNNRSSEAAALANLGNAFFGLKEYQTAGDHLNQALLVSRDIKDRVVEGRTLSNIGAVSTALGRYDEAIQKYNEALVILRDIGDPTSEAAALKGLAEAELGRGSLSSAREYIENSLKIVEKLRSRIFNQESRSAYFASVQEYNKFHIDVLMRLHRSDPASGYDRLAVEASERSSSRGLLELLTESGAQIRQGVDPALLEREQTIARRLNDKAAQQITLLAQSPKAERLASLRKELSQLETDYEQVQASIRRTSPRYAALVQPQPLSLDEMQRMLDPETLILKYSLGKQQSYLWLISDTSFTNYILPKSEEVEESARNLYKLLTERHSPQPNQTPVQKLRLAEQAEAELLKIATQLRMMVLDPVADKLGRKRIVIVADGALHYVPFAMLPAPEGNEGPKRGKQKYSPFIVEHEISYLPSVSALALQRREATDRQHPNTLAVIADPVFQKNDVRVVPIKDQEISKIEKPAAEANNTRQLVHAVESKFAISRLPFTRQEADQILSSVPASSGLKAINFEANREMVLSGKLSKYRYVHFATHGYLDTERPGLSALVLSMVDEHGQRRDGFLRAHEIYNLDLPAELVVLSACQTGLGKEIKGEGLIGLTRGFMYAGTSRVVVSLWSVNDKATSDLMTRFYQKMLKQGERPAAALRSAQLEMWKQKQWQSPYYWAAFTMQGEWR